MPRETRNITDVLQEIPTPEEMSFLALAEAIHRAGFTGPTTIHWKAGVPMQVDLGSPVKLSIVQPSPRDKT